VVVAHLPSPRFGIATMWDGRNAYLLGGRTIQDDRSVDSSDILRFDARTQTVTRLPERLPATRAFAAGAWTGDHGLLFGGESVGCAHDGCPGRDVILFQPDRHAVATLEVRLPQAVTRTHAARLGDSALLAVPGGDPPLVRFDLVERRARPLEAGPGARVPAEAAFVSDGTFAYLVGGRGDTKPVLRFSFDVTGRPSAPRNLQAFPGESPGRIALSWDPPTHRDGVDGYRVYRSLGRDRPVFVAAVDDTVFLDQGLPVGKQARYRVAAVNGAGEGSAAEVTIHVPGLPCPPRDLKAVPGPRAKQVTLRWSTPTCDGGLPIERYAVYRVPWTGDPVLIGSVSGHAFTYAPPTQATQRYVVKAVNAAGEGRAAGPVTGRIPDPPEPPRMLGVDSGNGALRVRWEESASSLPLTRYVLERSVDKRAYETLAELGPTASSHTDEGCPLARECRYRVRAVNPAGHSAPSNVARGQGGAFSPAFELREDRTVYVYNDADRDGKADAGEGLAVTPRPPA